MIRKTYLLGAPGRIVTRKAQMQLESRAARRHPVGSSLRPWPLTKGAQAPSLVFQDLVFLGWRVAPRSHQYAFL